MKATIDKVGRLILPPAARDAIGLVPGGECEISVRDGILEIAPSTLPVRFERQGHITVAVPLIPVPPMPEGMVEETLNRLRQEREGLGERRANVRARHE